MCVEHRDSGHTCVPSTSPHLHRQPTTCCADSALWWTETAPDYSPAYTTTSLFRFFHITSTNSLVTLANINHGKTINNTTIRLITLRTLWLFPHITRGDQKVSQLGYKKLTCYAVVFLSYSHATSTHIFYFCSLLFMPWISWKQYFLFRLSDHAFTEIFSDSSSINQVPWRRYFRFLIKK